jgi:DNA-binding transcriptional ArsR family regulator
MPEATPDLAQVCAALADQSRAAMALSMMDGRAWTVSELADMAGVARSTATEHAHRLVAVGLCVEVRESRHRYLRLRDGHVAEVLESIGTLAKLPPPRPTLKAVRGDAALRAGRTCYRHLAGALGVSLTARLREMGVITPTWELGPQGRDWFAGFGIDVRPSSRRPLLRPCLDWTERRDHLAGQLGDELCATMLDRNWISRKPGTRAVALTDVGRDGLAAHGLAADDLDHH